MTRSPSRPKLWADAVAQATEGLDTLLGLQQEYAEWLDNISDVGLEESATGELLEAIGELDLESALETVQEAAGTDLPRGFGRD